jgi:hypothetical protein
VTPQIYIVSVLAEGITPTLLLVRTTVGLLVIMGAVVRVRVSLVFIVARSRVGASLIIVVVGCRIDPPLIQALVAFEVVGSGFNMKPSLLLTNFTAACPYSDP